jgi:hypothetical protein
MDLVSRFLLLVIFILIAYILYENIRKVYRIRCKKYKSALEQICWAYDSWDRAALSSWVRKAKKEFPELKDWESLSKEARLDVLGGISSVSDDDFISNADYKDWFYGIVEILEKEILPYIRSGSWTRVVIGANKLLKAFPDTFSSEKEREEEWNNRVDKAVNNLKDLT